MKLWEKAAFKEFRAVWDKWKMFSETGNCNDGIDCRFCPLREDDRCPTYGPRDMREVAKALDEEAVL